MRQMVFQLTLANITLWIWFSQRNGDPGRTLTAKCGYTAAEGAASLAQ